MTTTYQTDSLYYSTQQTSWYLSNWVYRPIPSDSTDSTIIIDRKYNFRPDLLAYDLYSDPNLWWTFFILNPDTIQDPLFDFVSGTQIQVAQRDRLYSLLGS